MVIAYIALGSNLGDREYYIRAALKKIKQLPSTKVIKVSSLRETEPEGGPAGQGRYINGVIEIVTELFPYPLLGELQEIERELGRVRECENGPRTIDLDILSYGETVIREEALCIPHPRMFARRFVLEPLEEIAPGKAGKLRRLAETAGGKKKSKSSRSRPKPKAKKRRK